MLNGCFNSCLAAGLVILGRKNMIPLESVISHRCGSLSFHLAACVASSSMIVGTSFVDLYC